MKEKERKLAHSPLKRNSTILNSAKDNPVLSPLKPWGQSCAKEWPQCRIDILSTDQIIKNLYKAIRLSKGSKKYHVKSLFKGFHMNGHTIGFCPEN